VGCRVGNAVGLVVGTPVGVADGLCVGCWLDGGNAAVGVAVAGGAVGTVDGAAEGDADGAAEGDAVGDVGVTTLGATDETHVPHITGQMELSPATDEQLLGTNDV
jgi:hypothetical protein